MGSKVVSVRVPEKVAQMLGQLPQEKRSELLRLAVEAVASVAEAKASLKAMLEIYRALGVRVENFKVVINGNTYFVTVEYDSVSGAIAVEKKEAPGYKPWSALRCKAFAEGCAIHSKGEVAGMTADEAVTVLLHALKAVKG